MKVNKNRFVKENTPGFIVHRLDSLLKLGLHRAFKANNFDFTVEQWGILFKLYRRDGLHQSELADLAGKDRHNTTRILNLLEKKGYIQRIPDKDDKRCYNIFLTEKSREIEESLILTVINFIENAFCGLSQREVTEMQRVHEHIIANVESFLKES